MKNLKSLVPLLLMLFLLTACGSIEHNTIVPSKQENTLGELTNQPQEEELSKFSTEIQIDDPDRDKNIDITCKKLNETTVPLFFANDEDDLPEFDIFPKMYACKLYNDALKYGYE